MPLNEITSRLIAMAEYADALCRRLPVHHRAAMQLRDFATGVENAIRSLSETTRKHIAMN